MTPCLDEAYDNLIGSDFNDKLKRKLNLTGSALQGIDTLTALTGCKQPCHSIKYRVKKMASINLENNRDLRGSHLLDSNSSSLIYVIHVPRPTIKQLEEIKRYTAISFISDVGGICGVFLGISFWSIYQILVLPLLNKLQSLSSKS